MTVKKETYQERAERLARIIDIAEKIIKESTIITEDIKSYHFQWSQKIKQLALNPEPQFKKVASLKFLEHDFLVYWNDTIGPDAEKFWSELRQNGISFQRNDLIEDVLKKGGIKNMQEYDYVIDNIVVADQLGRINNEQVVELNKLLAEFEKKNRDKKF